MTSGALVGPGSAIVGAAAHIAIHGTSGILVGPGALLAGISVHSGAGAQVAAPAPDTHDGYGGHYVPVEPRDEHARRLDRAEVRQRLEAAFRSADEALAPVAEVVNARGVDVSRETPAQLEAIQAALDAIMALDRMGLMLASAQQRQLDAYRRQLTEAEEELALLMALAELI